MAHEKTRTQEGRRGHKEALSPSAWARFQTSPLRGCTRSPQSMLAIPLGLIPSPRWGYRGTQTQNCLRIPCLA